MCVTFSVFCLFTLDFLRGVKKNDATVFIALFMDNQRDPSRTRLYEVPDDITVAHLGHFFLFPSCLCILDERGEMLRQLCAAATWARIFYCLIAVIPDEGNE